VMTGFWASTTSLAACTCSHGAVVGRLAPFAAHFAARTIPGSSLQTFYI
jgi:hypothetical protein